MKTAVSVFLGPLLLLGPYFLFFYSEEELESPAEPFGINLPDRSTPAGTEKAGPGVDRVGGQRKPISLAEPQVDQYAIPPNLARQQLPGNETWLVRVVADKTGQPVPGAEVFTLVGGGGGLALGLLFDGPYSRPELVTRWGKEFQANNQGEVAIVRTPLTGKGNNLPFDVYPHAATCGKSTVARWETSGSIITPCPSVAPTGSNCWWGKTRIDR